MMTTVLTFGFLIGLRHALEADHVAAVASLVMTSRSLRQSVRLGAAWGLGHALTLLVVGGLLLASGKALPPGVAHWLEVVVGVMLIGLGADVLRRLIRQRVHFHSHRHGHIGREDCYRRGIHCNTTKVRCQGAVGCSRKDHSPGLN